MISIARIFSDFSKFNSRHPVIFCPSRKSGKDFSEFAELIKVKVSQGLPRLLRDKECSVRAVSLIVDGVEGDEFDNLRDAKGYAGRSNEPSSASMPGRPPSSSNNDNDIQLGIIDGKWATL